MSAPHTHRLLCALLAAITIAAGLIWRLAPLGLPAFWFKYGGSILWAVMIYWLFAAAFPESRAFPLSIYSCAFAAAVELSRLHHSAAEDAFRVTLAGKLLLGRVFSINDIAAYWIAILATALIDHLLVSKA